jgi:hypothetical protein
MNPNKDAKVLNVLLWCAFLFIVVWATSCATQKNAEKWANKKPVKAAAWATKKWPPFEWTRTIRDTLIDSVDNPVPYPVIDSIFIEGKPYPVHIKCPPSQTITKYIKEKVETRVRDSAATIAMQGQLDVANGVIQAQEKEIAVLSDKLKDAKEGRSIWRLYCLITWAIVALYIILKLRAKIPF